MNCVDDLLSAELETNIGFVLGSQIPMLVRFTNKIAAGFPECIVESSNLFFEFRNNLHPGCISESLLKPPLNSRPRPPCQQLEIPGRTHPHSQQLARCSSPGSWKVSKIPTLYALLSASGVFSTFEELALPDRGPWTALRLSCASPGTPALPWPTHQPSSTTVTATAPP